MCGRYAITLPPEAVRQWFQTHGELPNWPAYYNAAPTTALPVVRQGQHARVCMNAAIGSCGQTGSIFLARATEPQRLTLVSDGRIFFLFPDATGSQR
jgi:putative SOS response-associated peptidase YedK